MKFKLILDSGQILIIDADSMELDYDLVFVKGDQIVAVIGHGRYMYAAEVSVTESPIMTWAARTQEEKSLLDGLRARAMDYAGAGGKYTYEAGNDGPDIAVDWARDHPDSTHIKSIDRRGRSPDDAKLPDSLLFAREYLGEFPEPEEDKLNEDYHPGTW